MANYATNNFFAQTENEKDLITIEQFIEENFCDSYMRDMDNVSRVNFTPNGNVLKKKWMN